MRPNARAKTHQDYMHASLVPFHKQYVNDANQVWIVSSIRLITSGQKRHLGIVVHDPISKGLWGESTRVRRNPKTGKIFLSVFVRYVSELMVRIEDGMSEKPGSPSENEPKRSKQEYKVWNVLDWCGTVDPGYVAWLEFWRFGRVA